MWSHLNLGRSIFSRKRRFYKMIQPGKITLRGNSRLKIYGSLDCKSGKRMKSENRIFFSSKQEAQKLKYRPCGNCLRQEYQNWKDLRMENYDARFKAAK